MIKLNTKRMKEKLIETYELMKLYEESADLELAKKEAKKQNENS